MTNTFDTVRSTYEHASPQLKPYVQTLWPGSYAAAFSLRDQDGRPLALHDDHLSGRSMVLLFNNEPSHLVDVLSAMAPHAERLEALGARVLVINASSDARQNARFGSEVGVNWPILGDSTGAVFAGYGLHKGGDIPARAVLLTPLRQVRAWFDFSSNPSETADTIMTELNAAESAQMNHWTTTHAPVLQVPGVLSREECDQLIRLFAKDEPLMIRPPRSGELAGNYKIPVYEHNRQDRIDQILKDPQTVSFLDERIWGRVVPMVKKAFAYEITRREDLHIARYEGKRGGNAMGHRDNVSPATAYRRFALSLNLNDDYDGGEVAFNEYGNQRYKSVAGTALVFSSALLHEVLETTRGTRYTLISHFYNEQSLPGQ